MKVLKTCLCLALGFFVIVPTCAAEDAARVTTIFMDRSGKELCRFRVQLAVTPEEQARGLMFRKELEPDSGMLFVNNTDAMRSFWMKNTYLPLDIIFIDSRHEVKHVHYGAKPLSEAAISSQYPVQYVLEVNAGKTKKCGIGPGSKMSIQVNVR